MHKKITRRAFCSMLLALPFPVQAQQPAKVTPIGYLVGGSSAPARIEAFRQGLREHGYVEGKNIVIEWRFADEKLDRLPAQSQPCFGYRPDVSLSARDHDPLRAAGLQLKSFRQPSWHYAERSVSVHKKLNFFDTPGRTGQMGL